MDQIESEIEQVYAGSRKKKLDRDVRPLCESGFVLQRLPQKMCQGTWWLTHVICITDY